MTYARKEIIHEEEVGVYHCISRCVRRAFLCGYDKFSQRSFEHRREWIRGRLSKLAHLFAVEVIAYAAMSNHLHMVVRIRPDVARSWSADEVARRWLMLFPKRGVDGQALPVTAADIQLIATQQEKVALYRARLSSLSWFNRCLNENIARRANLEDNCKGRFWEGRFRCQRVDSIGGLLACAAYVDLNPIRAGVATTPEDSDHTSIQDRIHEMKGSRPNRCCDWEKVPLVSIAEVTDNLIDAQGYLKLVDESGRALHAGKNSIAQDLQPILTRLNIVPHQWHEITKNLGRKFKRIIGPAEALVKAAERSSKQWFQGLNTARVVFNSTS